MTKANVPKAGFTTRLLNSLHRNGHRGLICVLSALVYFLKGYGLVKVAYHNSYRAYEYRVKRVSYMSIGPGWAYNHNYLRDLIQDSFCYDYMPKVGDCVFDIGAGLGEETVIYANVVGPGGRIIALEANPVTFNGLNYMCLQNEFSWVTPLNLAVFSSDGEVTIEDNVDNYLQNTINASTASSIRVKAKTLDTIVKENGIQQIDFLKANIEGAEQFLVHGMSEASNIIKNMCISCHDFRHNINGESDFYLTKKIVIDFLVAKGFTVRTRNTGNALIDDYVYAKK